MSDHQWLTVYRLAHHWAARAKAQDRHATAIAYIALELCAIYVLAHNFTPARAIADSLGLTL